MSSQLAGTLPSTRVNNSKIISSSGRNNKKLAKSDFIKTMHKTEESSFLILNTS